MKLFAGGREVAQCRFAKCVGKLGIVNGTCEHQYADHHRNSNDGVLVSARLSPVGLLAGDKVYQFLDASRSRTPHLGRLTRHFRDKRGGGATRFNTLYMRF